MSTRVPGEPSLSLSDLLQQIRALASLGDESNLPPDWPAKILRTGLSLIRAAAIHLFLQGKNPQGLLIAYEEDVIFWKTDPEYMEQILAGPTRKET